MKTSDFLVVGDTYTRAQLKATFGITDATINNGIYKPRGHDSVWIFITKEKTSDRTQYADSLVGDLLHMEGQTKGRTDHLIKQHIDDGLELIVFYRDSKLQFPGAGFTYEGTFNYESSEGSEPTRFVLRKSGLKLDSNGLLIAQGEAAASAGDFDPKGIQDGRDRVLAAIVRRRGQPAFRAAMLKAYQHRCAVTGCAVPAILEAAHIHPYKGEHTNVPSNGLLLRSDVHTLFDLRLMSVDPVTFTVVLAPGLMNSEYAHQHGKSIFIPERAEDRASSDALKWHRERCEW